MYGRSQDLDLYLCCHGSSAPVYVSAALGASSRDAGPRDPQVLEMLRGVDVQAAASVVKQCSAVMIVLNTMWFMVGTNS